MEFVETGLQSFPEEGFCLIAARDMSCTWHPLHFHAFPTAQGHRLRALEQVRDTEGERGLLHLIIMS